MKKRVLFLSLPLFLLQSGVHAEDLMEVYGLAVDNDASLRAARATRDAALEIRPQSRAKLLPNAALGAGLSRRDIDTDGANDGSATHSNLSLSLSQSIYNRADWVQLEQADVRIAQAQAEYSAAEQELILRVTEAYFNVLSALDSLEFAQAENAAIARQLDQAKQRFEVGLIAITDVLEAQAAYDQSRADLIQAENNVGNAWEALNEIINTRPSSLETIAEEIPLNPPVPADIERWDETAQQQNLAIQAARYRTEVAKQNIDVQRSGHYPTLGLVGLYDLDRNDPGSDTDMASIGLQLDVPLYSGGAITSRTKQAMYEYEAAQERLDQQRRAASRQVRDAYRAVVASISAVEALKANTVSTQSALEATEAGFEVGTRTMVDVLNAQRDLFRAKSNYSKVRYSYILSGLKLKQASGALSQDDLKQVNSLLRK